MTRVITFGTFDLFHIGHVRILERASALGDHLTVGVSTDALNFSKKQLLPIFNERDRAAIVGAIRHVDHVFMEESLDLKADYIKEHRADILVMGDDWAGRFDHLSDLCEVRYLPRTQDISSTLLKTILGEEGGAAAKKE